MPYVDKVKSVKKTRGFPNRGERYGAKYENWVTYLLSYTVSVEKLWTQNTRIFHDVWRLLILSNEEKRMIMKILKKEWFIWKFWEKGGVVEKRGEEETKSMPHAPVICFLCSLISYCRFIYDVFLGVFLCVLGCFFYVFGCFGVFWGKSMDRTHAHIYI